MEVEGNGMVDQKSLLGIFLMGYETVTIVTDE